MQVHIATLRRCYARQLFSATCNAMPLRHVLWTKLQVKYPLFPTCKTVGQRLSFSEKLEQIRFGGVLWDFLCCHGNHFDITLSFEVLPETEM